MLCYGKVYNLHQTCFILLIQMQPILVPLLSAASNSSFRNVRELYGHDSEVIGHCPALPNYIELNKRVLDLSIVELNENPV